MADFKVGDVVQLKSRGPKMTIAEIKDGIALCHWFDGSKHESKSFPVTIIEKPKRLAGGIIVGHN